jgi:hypothetical protein
MRLTFSVAIACLAAVLVLPLAGCVTVVGGGSGVTGSGVIKDEERPVAGFSAVTLVGVGKVTLKQTGREALTVRAEDNLLTYLESRVAGSTLTLKVADGVTLRPTRPIEFIIEVKALGGLSLSGSGSIEAAGLDGKKLTVSVLGAGDVTLAGRVEDLGVTLSGAGSYRGDELPARRATVHSTGSGTAVVNVGEELNVNVLGVGSVEYLGSPHVTQTVTGVGRVRKR